jgi:nucleoside-diphosphate-sugar epimerase
VGERVLVTGGGGFVGACLTRALIREGRAVHLLLRPQTNRWRLAGLEGACTAHTADLLDEGAVRAALAAARPDAVFHLATHGHRPEQRRRATVMAANLLGTANLLDAVLAEGCRTFVHAGSGLEYGPHEEAVPETAAVNPRTDYTVAKAAATLLCLADSHGGRPVVVVRVFHAYGPWEDPSRLVPYVMGCCLRHETPRVSAGLQRRDFIHVEDVVALLLRAAALPPTPGLVLHAGSGREHSVRDLIETVVAVSGSKVVPAFAAEALRPNEPAHYLASIERTTALTGWAPRFDLRTGIEQTWEWFREHANRVAA